jgi:tetratricopeptide (TPR) repeat protein
VTGSLFDQYKAALRRGHLAALAGDLEGALQAYGEAARLVPERALPIASQGTVLHRLDRWPEAAEAFDLALQIAPDDEAALRARAVARAERGLRSGAAADFERLAFVLDVGSRSGEAAEAARRAVDLEPSATREALAQRLTAAAAHVADLQPPRAGSREPGDDADEPSADARLADAAQQADELAAGPDVRDGSGDAVAVEAVAGSEAMAMGERDAASAALAARIAELGTQPSWVDTADRPMVAGEVGDVDADGRPWPPIDLPSPPPPPIEGPPPDPETLLAEAAVLIDAGDPAAARDRMLLAVMVHREAGRLDAAIEACLQLLTMAPGDPRVHLAIANLQLDRGWTSLATEKIELLLRLTALTGDTQAEADAHGLAAERLRDGVLSASSPR